MRELLFVAGEASGDLHAAGVAEALRRRVPSLAMTGVGGERMAAAGVELIERSERLAVMGFLEVLTQVPRHWSLLRALRKRFASGRVGLVVLVDYPGFNLRVAAAAREAGVPVLYYITPQIWAWRAKRVHVMARTITRAAVILPFEEKLLRAHDIDARFVGHPLLDHAAEMPTREEARARLGLPLDAPVLALFPGSRATEIAQHLDAFVTTARLLESRMPGLRTIVSVAPSVTIDRARCPYQLVPSASFTVWRAADAALAKSGTSTLEAALAGCPLIVAYRAGRATAAIARRLMIVRQVGLVNLVTGRTIAPEFVQEHMRPDAMAAALAPLLRDSPARRQMLAELAAVRASLGECGAAERVAALALEMLA